MERLPPDVTRILAERTGTKPPRQKYQPKTPGLLRLPLELRVQIFRYLLPYTSNIQTTYGRRAYVWNKGQTSILAVNRQIHAEAADLMYGDAVFVVEVGFDSILFRPRFISANDSISPITPAFLDVIQPNCVKRVRNLAINIQHVDSYTGMIKFNYSGDGLTDGLRKQVLKLVTALSTAKELRNVRVRMAGGNSDPDAASKVLEPLTSLRNVRGQATVDGGAAEVFRKTIVAAMLNREAEPAMLAA